MLILQEQGKESEAFDHLIKLLRIQKTDEATVELSKRAYNVDGWRGVLRERIRLAEADTNPRYFQLACLHSKMGNKDQAFEYLEKAYQDRRFQVPMIEIEPQLIPLRDDPRYQDLVRRINSN